MEHNAPDVASDATNLDIVSVSSASAPVVTSEAPPSPAVTASTTVTVSPTPDTPSPAAAAEEYVPISKQGVMDEGLDFTFEVVNEGEGGKKPRIRVPVAQRGDDLNRNRRYYPWNEVLKPYAIKLKEKAQRGELLMEDFHRTDPEGKRNVRRLVETVARIWDIGINERDKTFSLEDIEFLKTDAGRNMHTIVVEHKVPVMVSQRADGAADIRIWRDGKPYEHVTMLEGDGYDFVPPGRAGVRDAQIQVLLEERRNRLNTQGDTQVDETTQTIETPAAAAAPNPPVQVEVIPATVPVPPPAPAIDRAEIQRMVEEQTRAVLAQMTPAPDDRIEALLTEHTARQQAAEVEKQRNENRALLEGLLDGEDYKRFNERQRKLLLESIELDGSDEIVKARLARQVMVVDEATAASKLQSMGYQMPGVQAPVHISVNENVPNSAFIQKLNEDVRETLCARNDIEFAKESPARAYAKKLFLDQFDRWYGAALKNEAAGVAANMPQIMSYSRVVMEQAFPLLVSLDLVQSMTMDAITQVIFEEVYDQPLNASLTAMMVGEGGTAPTASLRMRPYTVYATDKKLRTSFTPEQLAMAQGIPNYDLVRRTLAALARDYARRTDLYIFALAVAQSDMQDFREVRTAETLVQKDSTQEWESAHRAWVEFEYFKKYDEGSNQPTARLARIGETTGSPYQQVVVLDGSTTLTRGFLQSSGAITVNEDGTGGAADYYVKYANGSVVLAAGLPSGTLTAKYVYTLNTQVWSRTPASGVDFWVHLRNLQIASTAAQTLMANRFYEPSAQVTSRTVAGWMTSSDLFTSAGNTPPNRLNSDNSIGLWAGSPVFSSTNMRDDKILYLTPDAIQRAVWQPWRLRGPEVDTLTGEESYIGIEFTAEDVVIKDKLTSVTITD